MRIIWNGVAIAAEPSMAERLQSIAEDAEFEEVGEAENKLAEAKEDE